MHKFDSCRNICRSAARVWAYIGAETEGDQLAFDALTRLCEFSNTDKLRHRLESASNLEMVVISRHFFNENAACWDQHSPARRALQALVRRPYFQRMWIVPELALASKRWFYAPNRA